MHSSRRKSFIAVALTSLALASAGNAIQVLPAPSPGLGHSFGRGLGDGFSRGMEMGLMEARQRKELQRIQKEREEQIAKERAILEEILKDYDPAQNSRSVLKVIQSDLSSNTKEIVINALNEQHKTYLEENKTKGTLSWLKSWF